MTSEPQTQVFDTSLDDEREQGLSAAATAIRRAGLAVIPTDTVYGVAADAFSPPGVKALLAAKGRDRDMPVPVLVSTPEMLTALVDNLPDVARRLVDALWPGGLTLVVKHTTHLAWDLGFGFRLKTADATAWIVIAFGVIAAVAFFARLSAFGVFGHG